MSINNETIGISMEVAIAKSFGILINPDYEKRSEKTIVDLIIQNDSILKILKKEEIPIPIRHIAERQNPIDFILQGEKSLSVKTNQKELGKIAPQKIGQPTSETYFAYLEEHFCDFSLQETLAKENLEDSYANRAYIFKKISIEHIEKVIEMYWEMLFDCDYYIHFFNIALYANPLDNYLFLQKEKSPLWRREKFTFTQSLENWNESNTVKYCGISIGEFQVHKNRNCLKFRFNMKGVIKVLGGVY